MTTRDRDDSADRAMADRDGLHAALVHAGTSVIADVMDAAGTRPLVLHPSIAPLTPGRAFAGPAFTVEGRMEDWETGGDRTKLAAIDAMPAGCVAVWAGNDIEGMCCFGDLLATSMAARGCAGVVVDGGIRDASHLAGLPLPIVTRYRSPAQAIGRWRVSGHGATVRLRGAIDPWVEVAPGDVIVSDDDGTIVVPAADVARTAAAATAWADGETDAREAIADGMPLLAALDRFGHL